MVSKDSVWTDCAFTRDDGSDGLLSWNPETWFFDYSRCEYMADEERDCLTVELNKRYVSGDADVGDENASWGKDEFRFIRVSLDQVFMLTNGNFRRADELIAGVDCVQSKCGNGHFSRVMSVAKAGRLMCRGVKTFPHGTVVVGGVVMGAENHG